MEKTDKVSELVDLGSALEQTKGVGTGLPDINGQPKKVAGIADD